MLVFVVVVVLFVGVIVFFYFLFWEVRDLRSVCGFF